MSRNGLLVWLMTLGMVIPLLLQVIPAHAQEPTPENDANCVACHEHQYYLYDRGKWFCLCEAPMHCVYCHGGRTDTPLKDAAHEGLVLYPTREHAERCQSCHPEDYMSRVVTFASVAGISSTPRPIITATAVPPIVSLGEQGASLLLRLSHLETWRLVGLSAVCVALLGLIFFAIRCYQADCLQRR